MNEVKKTKDKSQNYLKTFRNGAIAANIFRRQSPSGFEYLDFSLSRSWKTKQGDKEGYSSSFFEKNDDDLHASIDDAVGFIRAQMYKSEALASADDMTEPLNGTPAAGEAV